MKVRAGLLERGTLRVRARKLLDKGDEAFRNLLKDGSQLDRHNEILAPSLTPASNLDWPERVDLPLQDPSVLYQTESHEVIQVSRKGR
jgi:hypothetical protein